MTSRGHILYFAHRTVIALEELLFSTWNSRVIIFFSWEGLNHRCFGYFALLIRASLISTGSHESALDSFMHAIAVFFG